MKMWVFRVNFEHRQNGLCGSVDVIALNTFNAKRLAKDVFFRGNGWKITSCEKLRELNA